MSDYVTYKKVPLEIEYVQWLGTNYKEICDFIGMRVERDASELFNGEPSNLLVPTFEGTFELRIFDSVIKDKQGNLYVLNTT